MSVVVAKRSTMFDLLYHSFCSIRRCWKPAGKMEDRWGKRLVEELKMDQGSDHLHLNNGRFSKVNQIFFYCQLSPKSTGPVSICVFQTRYWIYPLDWNMGYELIVFICHYLCLNSQPATSLLTFELKSKAKITLHFLQKSMKH